MTYILEDDDITVELIGEILKSNAVVDFKIFTSSSDMIGQLTPEVQICVIDYFLGEKLTGLDVMKIVLASNPDCFVIVISGQQDPEVVADFLNNGAKRYVNKKDPKYLNKMVDYVLDALRMTRERNEKTNMLTLIQNKLTDLENQSNERRINKQNY